MKPFGMRYWENYDYYYMQKEEFLEQYSFQACSWIRDQEYLVDFKYYEDLYFVNYGHENYLHIFPKVRSVSCEARIKPYKSSLNQ